MLITTSFLPYTVGLNRAPDLASTRKLTSKEKAAFVLNGQIEWSQSTSFNRIQDGAWL